MAWIFEKKGFVSVVAYDPKKDDNKNSPFKKFAKSKNTHLLVRARIKDDLNSLKEVVPSLVIDKDPSADYAYRAVVSRTQFKKYLNKVTNEITYDSHFKEACRDTAPPVKDRYSALMSTWGIWSKLQDVPPYSGGYYSSGGGMSQPYVSPYGSDSNKAARESYEALPAFKQGKAEGTGFEPGMDVTGYFGHGVVKSVAPYAQDVDLVTVEYTSTEGVSLTGQFLGSYLYKGIYVEPEPETEPEVLEAEPVDTDEPVGMAALYDLLTATTVNAVMDDNALLWALDDRAYAFIEALDNIFYEPTENGCVPKAVLDKVYSEVRWETADNEERAQMIADDEDLPEDALGWVLEEMAHRD